MIRFRQKNFVAPYATILMGAGWFTGIDETVNKQKRQKKQAEGNKSCSRSSNKAQ